MIVDRPIHGISKTRSESQPVLQKTFDIVIVGGLGHVGLPLGLALADTGLRVCALDINEEAVKAIGMGSMPFHEPGTEELLQKALQNKHFVPSTDASKISEAQTIIIIVGTPVDDHLNPEFEMLQQLINAYEEYFVDDQLVVLRSTVYPGTTEKLQRRMSQRGKNIHFAFCPERIAEGKAIEELATLPQIVSAFSSEGLSRVKELFSRLTKTVLELEPIEAELSKLFSNVWRYTQFAVANQFFMIANDHNVDFYKIHKALTFDYPRLKDMAKPGFAAGPCLFKDTMQLAAFNNNHFFLGHAAMLVNEGLPNYIVERLKIRYPLEKMSVGILGMSFKAESDDKRSSLSYKLKKILGFESRVVFCSDPYIKNKNFISSEELLQLSDIIIVATPHQVYKNLNIPKSTIVVDVWNLWEEGCLI